MSHVQSFRFEAATPMRRGLMVALVLILGSTPALAQGKPDPRHPVIAGFGAITPDADTANQPDRTMAYRVAFSITKSPADPAQVNPSLDKVARFVNLLGSGGVSVQPGNIVAVVHGPATPLVLDDSAYQARFGRPNPNGPLIAALRKAGVEVHVCSQAMHGNGIDKASVASGIAIDLSAMTTVATLQLRGWALITD